MIRWIIEGRLGTAAFLDAVASGHAVLDVRHLVDGPGNSARGVQALVARGAEMMGTGAPLIVACDFGVSRSNSIAAGVLTLIQGIAFDAAAKRVMEQTSEENIKLSMLETVRAALEGTGTAAGTRGAILVTGATGFIGRNLVPALRASSRESVLAPNRAELDLTASSATLASYLRKNDVRQILHMAFPRIYTNVPAMGESLVMLRRQIEACTSLGITLTILSGADVFSGYRTRALLADLDTPPRAMHVYGETKLLEETLMRQAMQNLGLSGRILRLARVYGPDGLRPRFIRQIHDAMREGNDILVHDYLNGPARLELLYIDDAVAALCEIITRDLPGNFHIGTGAHHSPAEIAGHIASLTGSELKLQTASLEGYVSNVILGVHSDKSDLAWAPTTPLQTGLRKTLLIC